MRKLKLELDFEEALERINNDHCIAVADVEARALRRKVWVAEWHFFGCCSETNMGDTYALTVVELRTGSSRYDRRFIVTSWGDLVERNPGGQFSLED